MKNESCSTINKYRHPLHRTLLQGVLIIGFTVLLSSQIIANDLVSNARLPMNAEATCKANIDPWFVAGYVSENGWVRPANSLAPQFAEFNSNTRCDFYRWGAQMFLWLTSEVGDRHVFTTTPVFYNLSVESNQERSFLTENGPMLMTVRKGKTDQEIEVGQAGNSDALLSQNEALVYYGLHANDVYALFTTQHKITALKECKSQYTQCTSEVVGLCLKDYKSCKVAAIPKLEFPNTKAQLKQVSEFAKDYGYRLGWDKIALAMELKTSWVDANTLSDSSRYVLGKAVVPVFDRNKPKGPWPVASNQEKTLALVGMHVVGTVKGHPEMIWSTFEHVDNVPNNAYIYNISATNTKTQPYDSSGIDWTFLPTNAAKPTKVVANAQVNADKHGSLAQTITSIQGNAIGSTKVVRADPWGNKHGSQAGSPQVANNTDLVSINYSVLSQLSTGDVRGNYIQTGGIWTAKGQIPKNGTADTLRGSLNLANTTLETYYQYLNNSNFNPINCFGCHGSKPSDATGVSHVFDALQPLPKKNIRK